MLAATFDRNARRAKRVRATITGTPARPRVSVYRSNKYIYAQAIDDVNRVTIASATSIADKEKSKVKKTDKAKKVGQDLAKSLLAKKIKTVVFDRGRYAYNGRVKMLAEGLREEGISV